VPASQPTTNDQYVEAILALGGNGFPLCIRANTASALGQAIVCRRNNAGSIINLFHRNSSGTLTSLGTYTASSGDLATNPVRLEGVGTDITVKFMGATILGPFTDPNTYGAVGSVAVLSRGGSATTTTPTFDNMAWGDVGAGAVTHATTGALTGDAATVSGVSARTRAHATSGTLIGQGAVVAGSGNRAVGAVSHAASGALQGQGTSIAGIAVSNRTHATSGALAGLQAAIAGSVSRSGPAVVHAASGALIGQGGLITGVSAFGSNRWQVSPRGSADWQVVSPASSDWGVATVSPSAWTVQ